MDEAECSQTVKQSAVAVAGRSPTVWAAAAGVVRLELTVMAHNAAAIALYQKCGYRIDGRRTASLLVADELIDELAMAKVTAPARGTSGSR